MRAAIVLLLALAGCAGRSDDNYAAAVNAATPAAGTGPNSDQPSSSAAARDARKLAERYVALVNAKDYRAARAMWGHGGNDVGGTAEAFAKTFSVYSSYKAEAGEPTEVKAKDGQQYVGVVIKAKVTYRQTGRTADLLGQIHFRRSADPKETNPDARGWTIWAVDLRRPH